MVKVKGDDIHYTPDCGNSLKKLSAGFPDLRGNTSTIIRRRNEAPPENKKEK
jgi:hypothetical protein